MRKQVYFLLMGIIIFSLVGCKGSGDDKSVTISAAASLTDALLDIESQFEKETGIDITYNFASSGTLQKQIEEGAPVDAFISASLKKMDVLQEKNFIDRNTRKNILKNRLVLIVSKEYKDRISKVEDLLNEGIKLSIGTPESVPAGRYAKQSIVNMGFWDKLEDKIVYAKDVRQVVTYVDNGDVDVGIVYSSDTTIMKNSIKKELIKEEYHDGIVYPVAIIKSSEKKDLTKKFVKYLNTEEAKNIFKRYGFNIFK